MIIRPARIPELLVIEPDVVTDARGFFQESYHQKKFSEAGLDVQFVQDNHSRSSKGVLRGLHYQLNKAQGKLVRVTSGIVFDVAVDIRKGSPTFGQWLGIELSEDNHKQLYIPAGFAHGFTVLSETADFLYKCTEYYVPEDEYGIAWDDPEIGIDWMGDNFLVSERDRCNKSLHEMEGHVPLYEASG